MRIRDAYQFPSRRFQFAFETERTLLKNFQLGEPSSEDVGFLVRVLDPTLAFLSEVDCDGELPNNVAALFLRTRAVVRERDYGIMSYSFERALAGEFEICSARLLSALLGRLQQVISLNAGAFHSDEYLQPEDEFRDAFSAWRIKAGSLILAMSDLCNRVNQSKSAADMTVFSGLTEDQIDQVLQAVDFVPSDYLPPNQR